jgi:hypothetical protein
LRIGDLEREVHAALQVEPQPQAILEEEASRDGEENQNKEDSAFQRAEHCATFSDGALLAVRSIQVRR